MNVSVTSILVCMGSCRESSPSWLSVQACVRFCMRRWLAHPQKGLENCAKILAIQAICSGRLKPVWCCCFGWPSFDSIAMIALTIDISSSMLSVSYIDWNAGEAVQWLGLVAKFILYIILWNWFQRDRPGLAHFSVCDKYMKFSRWANEEG